MPESSITVRPRVSAGSPVSVPLRLLLAESLPRCSPNAAPAAGARPRSAEGSSPAACSGPSPSGPGRRHPPYWSVGIVVGVGPGNDGADSLEVFLEAPVHQVDLLGQFFREVPLLADVLLHVEEFQPGLFTRPMIPRRAQPHSVV